MDEKITTGSELLDGMLSGGYEKDVITTIYGPAGSGKSNLCMLCAVKNSKKRVVYIDTEGSFSVERLKQLTPDYKEILNNIVILKPTNFSEQKKMFEKLNKIVSDKIGLIIVDSIAMLYRLEMGKTNDIFNVNRELGVQLATLVQISRKFKIPIIITNQVYSDFGDKNRINVVGGDILRYACKCHIELQNENGNKKAILRKHRSLPEGAEISFRIVDRGIEKI